MNWMLDGARMLHEAKMFPVTKEQVALLKEYREENSSVDGFIGDCLDFTEGNLVETRELYENYKEYCHKDGRKFKSNIAFTKEMRAYGARHRKFGFRDREYAGAASKFEGIAINEEWRKHSLTHSFDHYGEN